MVNDDRPFRFLEPVYMNESMVLNCAAYLFSGVTVSTTATELNESRKSLAAKAGIPYLLDVIGLGGEASTSTSQQQESARRFTVGGLHMNVVDELHNKDMIKEITKIDDAVIQESDILDKYVHLRAILRPAPYPALLRTAQTLGPLISDVLHDYGIELIEKLMESRNPAEEDESEYGEYLERIANGLPKYTASILAAVNRLVLDYETAGQVEMLMFLDINRPVGVLDLDAEVDSFARLSAAIGGGRYHIFGKVSARVRTGQRLSLLQRTSLVEVALFLDRVFKGGDHQAQNGAAQGNVSNPQYDEFRKAMDAINKLVLLELSGPCIRVTAMSVCV